MNLLLLLFAIPFATIVFSIILQKIINSPILVALAAFAIFIILAVTIFDESFFILAVVYAIIAYLSAIITRLIKTIIRKCNNGNHNNSNVDNIEINNDLNDENTNNYYGCTKSEIIVDKNNMNRRYWR
ncbi:MAG: DUF2651 family protein [Clostridia bacterium]|nr:DUF2651 family protein [Clostridia bacterium]